MENLQDTDVIFSSQYAKNIYVSLIERYKKVMINKSELANELSISESKINLGIKENNGIPRYMKIGEAKNSTVRFSILDVSEFIADGLENAK